MRNSTLKFCAMLLLLCTSAIHLQAMDEWDGGTIAKGFYCGTGTKDNPYKIFTASQFLYFIQQTKDGNTFSGQYIELCNDVAFKDAEKLVNGGDFYGDFDGNDHTIQVNKYWEYYHDYIWGGWHLFNLYGSVHDVNFIRANEAVCIYTGGILYNCRFDFPGNYHGNWTVSLDGGTIANCVSNSASFQQRLEQHFADGFVSTYDSQGETPEGYCLNCYFPIQSRHYGGGYAQNYQGVIERCGEEAGNDWVLSHTEYDYKSWPLTFDPTYPEYQIEVQPQAYNPSVVYTHSDEAIFQWCYQERKPITFESIAYSTSSQTKNIVVSENDVVLSFDFEARGYTYTGWNDGDDHPAWIHINDVEVVKVYKEIEGTYSCQLSAGTHEISCERSVITNIRITYPTQTLANETSNVLSKQTIMARPGAYFCQVSYGEGCDVMYSDYVDYEKLLTIDDVTYVINDDATATVLWVADKAVDIIVPKVVTYDGVYYPVTSISSKAFVDCISLASIKCKALDALVLLGGNVFEGQMDNFIPSNVTLYVPNDSESTYSAAEGWRDFDIKETEIEVELIDGQTFNNVENKVRDISYYRTLPNLQWNALFVPFEIPVSDLTDEYDVAYINDIHSYDKDFNGEIDQMEMEVIYIKEGTLHANHPYLIRAKNDEAKEMSIVVTDATLYSSAKADRTSIACSSAYTDFEVIGTYEKMSAEELDGCYAISTSGAWSPIASGASLNPFRLYMTITNRDGSPVKVSQSAQARINIRVQGEDNATGITETENTKVKTENFDLSGRRVERMQKGIYIVNGKKVVR